MILVFVMLVVGSTFSSTKCKPKNRCLSSVFTEKEKCVWNALVLWICYIYFSFQIYFVDYFIFFIVPHNLHIQLLLLPKYVDKTETYARTHFQTQNAPHNVPEFAWRNETYLEQGSKTHTSHETDICWGIYNFAVTVKCTIKTKFNGKLWRSINSWKYL